MKGKDKDKYTAIVGGGIEGNLPSTQITMKSGAVTYLIGSSSGEKAAGKTYDVEDARITVAVSYTHLDVYKRQVSARVLPPVSARLLWDVIRAPSLTLLPRCF